MKITLPYRYTAEIVPPRCRKPRRVEQSATIALTLHEVAAQDAPVAIIQHGHTWNSTHRKTMIEYRYWRGKLFTRTTFRRACNEPYETQTTAQFLADPYPFNYETDRNYTGYSWHNESQAERRKSLMAWAAEQLFIDGQRWSVAGEPRYCIYTFGLGHNHGGLGTTLDADNHYNSNISRDRYFRIDQYDAALAEATRIATAHGDTDVLPIEKRVPPTRFEILIPVAVKLNPHKEHGLGCGFINAVESMIEGSPDAVTAGIGALAILACTTPELSRKAATL